MENVASAVAYNFSNSVNNLAVRCSSLYANKSLEQFMNREYKSPEHYIKNYQSFKKNVLIQGGYGDNSFVRLYVDNETIVNGDIFWRMSTVKETEWYQYLQKANLDTALYYYYDRGIYFTSSQKKRKIVLLRKLNYYPKTKKKILMFEMDYSSLIKNLEKSNYGMPVYICHNDTVIASNTENNSIGVEFTKFNPKEKVSYRKPLSLYGLELEIKVVEPEGKLFPVIKNNLRWVALLILGNIILPLIFMEAINESFAKRLKELSSVFNRVEDEHLIEIANVRGSDEIGSLMRNYNKMAARTNQLIQTFYINRLKEQEMSIAKQKAELLALHSQINPHFLFNALESIRMHSVLKGEFETADMVEKLAVMTRQNVEWSNDSVMISEEMGFVQAYLALQKYRFGERLSFELDVEEACEEFRIPKLTLVTFVENACVHGVERKMGSSWIFVRVYLEGDKLCLEIEDTGCGMSDVLMDELRDKMEHASIHMLKEKGRVGIINACLRLKMATKDEVHFEIDSEEGVGTLIQIRIPISYVKLKREGAYAESTIGG